MTGNNFPEEFQRIWKYSHGSLPKEEFDQAKKEAQIGFEKLHSDIVKEQPKAVHAYLRKRCDQTTLLLTCVAAMAMTLTSKIFLVLNCRLKNAYFILCIKMPVYLVCYITSVNI